MATRLFDIAILLHNHIFVVDLIYDQKTLTDFVESFLKFQDFYFIFLVANVQNLCDLLKIEEKVKIVPLTMQGK